MWVTEMDAEKLTSDDYLAQLTDAVWRVSCGYLQL